MKRGLVLLLFATLSIGSGSAAELYEGRASVVDGGTIEIGEQRIRIWGIDAPARQQQCTKDGKPWLCGADSANALAAFLGAQSVSCIKQERDSYGRIIGVCDLDGEDVGAWLVRNGWALDDPGNSAGAYSAEQAEAKTARRGLWQGEFEPPSQWRHD